MIILILILIEIILAFKYIEIHYNDIKTTRLKK